MFNNIVTQGSEKLGQKKEHIALAIVALPFVIMILFGGAHFIIDLVAYLYPAYASVRAIETEGTDDDTQWLTYWLVFSLFKIFEGIADVLLPLIPLYIVAKTAFLVWCFHPDFKGATVCYEHFIKPHMKVLFNDGSPASASASTDTKKDK
jgi:receptor expression-enhancing protein 5/6